MFRKKHFRESCYSFKFSSYTIACANLGPQRNKESSCPPLRKHAINKNINKARQLHPALSTTFSTEKKKKKRESSSAPLHPHMTKKRTSSDSFPQQESPSQFDRLHKQLKLNQNISCQQCFG